MDRKRLSQEQFERFSDFIYEQSGIRIKLNKILLLSNRIRRRVESCELGSFDEYYRYLKSRAGSQEIEFFLDVVTTNETFFFRTEKHFHWLRQEFFNELSQASQTGQRRHVRFWSAACASGAEPYSIAMDWLDHQHRMKHCSAEILATDISQAMLKVASEGIYKPRVMDSVSDQQKRKYFLHDTETDVWRVCDEVRERVEFRQHNLMDHPPGKFDCIFICNVLIYFDTDSKSRAIKHLTSALKPGGYLVVGPSEGISNLLDPLQRISPLIFQKQNGAESIARSQHGGASHE